MQEAQADPGGHAQAPGRHGAQLDIRSESHGAQLDIRGERAGPHFWISHLLNSAPK